MDSDIVASRVLGTPRQIWTDSSTTTGPDTFPLRPDSTRQVDGLAAKLLANAISGDKDEIWSGISRAPLGCSQSTFNTLFSSKKKPVLIDETGGPALWPAGSDNWAPSHLETFFGSERRVEVAGADATVSLGDYIRYMKYGRFTLYRLFIL